MSDNALPNGSSRSALMIAFHFPPLRGSSGIQRTLGFSRHLPKHGWTPIVLAPNSRAYESVDEKQMDLIPDGLAVERSFCLDSARHLSIGGRYLDRLAVPDRWMSWIPGAVLKGLRTIREHRPSVIWSTYPIATSHIIGSILASRSKLPWVADFRDPMVEWDAENETFVPSQPLVLKSRLKIERRCAESASALVFCTEQARDICLERYPTLSSDKCHVISNGYEEWSFAEAEKLVDRKSSQPKSEVLRLLHSGTIYPTPDRDPGPFFDAVSALKRDGVISASSLKITFRASGHDDYLNRLVMARGIDDIVELAPPLPYLDALAEMMTVDGLLIFQGHTSNPAIPAKLYEYLRSRVPILALLDSGGSTAELMEGTKAGVMAPIINAPAIQEVMASYLADVRCNRAIIASTEQIERFSRFALSKQLAGLFESSALERQDGAAGSRHRN